MTSEIMTSGRSQVIAILDSSLHLENIGTLLVIGLIEPFPQSAKSWINDCSMPESSRTRLICCAPFIDNGADCVYLVSRMFLSSESLRKHRTPKQLNDTVIGRLPGDRSIRGKHETNAQHRSSPFQHHNLFFKSASWFVRQSLRRARELVQSRRWIRFKNRFWAWRYGRYRAQL
jgi:hypothetical protein